MLKLSLLVFPSSSGLGGGSGFGLVYFGRYERGRGSSILTCFGADSGELRSSKAEVMSTATRPRLATLSSEEEVSELRCMMRVFIVGVDVALPLVCECELGLEVLLWSWSVFMSGKGSRDDVVRGKWQMEGMYKEERESCLCHEESLWTTRLHNRVETAREIEVLLDAKEYEGSECRAQPRASITSRPVPRSGLQASCSYKRGMTSFMLQYSFA